MDTTRCPICGTTNECAMARDPEAAECWCFTAVVTEQARAAIPEEARGQVCICPRCAAATEHPAPRP